MTPTKKTRTHGLNGGYTLLFSVLTAALVLGVAVFILSVSTKQYELSASARNSIYSFYAADSGIECATLAYYGGNAALDINTANLTLSPDNGAATIRCNGVTKSALWNSVPATPSLSPLTTNIQAAGPLDFSFADGKCSRIMVYDGYDSSSNHYTIIDSRGYNKCNSSGGPDVINPTTVERALRLTKKG
jgi:hypothetical protein